MINFVVAAAGGALLARLPARVIMSAGLGLTGVGLLMMGGLDPTDEWTALLGGFLVAGAGIGLLNPVIADVALSVVPKEQSGSRPPASTTRSGRWASRSNCCLGAILSVAQQRSRSCGGNPGGDRGTAPSADRGRLVGQPRHGAGDRAAGARGTVSNAAGEGFISGLNEIFALGGILALLAAVAALWLVRERDIEREPNAEAPVPITDPDGRAVPQPAPA